MITTLTGANHFMVRSGLDRQKDAFVKKYGNLAIEKFDGAEQSAEDMLAALQSIPFLSSNKLIILFNPSQAKTFTDAFEDTLPSIPDSTDVIIVEDKLDKRLNYAKTLKSKTDYHEFNELDTAAAGIWLVEQAKASGGTISKADALYLIERVGNNQEQLAHELEKLILYSPKVTRQSIDELTQPTPQSTIFELLDAAFSGNQKRAMHLYDEQRILKVEPQQIIAMLAWQLHVLAIIKTAGERSSQDIAKEARLNPFVVRKSQATAARISGNDLKRFIKKAHKLDITLKSQSIDADDALRYFLLSLTS